MDDNSRGDGSWGQTELLLLGITFLNCVALLRGGSANTWTLVEAASLALAFAAAPAFRSRVRAAWRGAWGQAASFPTARRSIPWAAVAVLVVLPDAALLLLRDLGMQSGDSRPVVMTAASLVVEGNLEISEYCESYRRLHLFTSTDEAPYFFFRRAGKVYSQYPAGMTPFALPIVAAARLSGADLHDPTVHERLEKLTATGVSAACLALFFVLALHVVDLRAAYAASAILATGSALFSTVGQALWQHGGVIFWMEILLLVEFRTWQAASWKSVCAQGVACAMLLACRLSAGLIVVFFGAWALARAPRRALAVAGVACLAALPWAVWQWSTYGTPLGPMSVQAGSHLWFVPEARVWHGVFLSPTHGLLTYQPWLLLIPLQLWPWPVNVEKPLERRFPLPPGWRAWAAAVVVAHVALVSSWHCWWGGWCWGSRLLSEDVPLLGLFLLQPLAMLMMTPARRRIVLAVAVIAACLHLPGVYLNQKRWYERHDVSYGSWSAPPFLFPLYR